MFKIIAPFLCKRIIIIAPGYYLKKYGKSGQNRDLYIGYFSGSPEKVNAIQMIQAIKLKTGFCVKFGKEYSQIICNLRRCFGYRFLITIRFCLLYLDFFKNHCLFEKLHQTLQTFQSRSHKTLVWPPRGGRAVVDRLLVTLKEPKKTQPFIILTVSGNDLFWSCFLSIHFVKQRKKCVSA